MILDGHSCKLQKFSQDQADTIFIAAAVEVLRSRLCKRKLPAKSQIKPLQITDVLPVEMLSASRCPAGDILL